MYHTRSKKPFIGPIGYLHVNCNLAASREVKVELKY